VKVTKGLAFIFGIIGVIILAAITLVIVPSAAEVIIPGAILGIVGVTTTYIGGNVADNALKGKFYNAALDKTAKE